MRVNSGIDVMVESSTGNCDTKIDAVDVDRRYSENEMYILCVFYVYCVYM